MNFDASNSSSYTGSNTAWNDISGNSYNATLASATYSSSNGGAFTFNGTNTYGYLSTLPSSISFSSGLSTTFYANFGATTQTWERIFDFGNGNASSNILVARSGNSDTLWYEIYNASGSSISTCSAANAIKDNAWAWYAITTNGTSCSIYVNGVSQTVSSTNPSVTPASIARTSNFIGRSNWSGDGYFDSGIGKLAIYNRGLTSAEVYQNYQAQADTCNASQSTANGWIIFKVTTTGTCQWFRPTPATSVEALIVGGGGAGGYDVAGGGGAGGLLYYGSENPKSPNGSALTLTQESYTVTVGGGGSGSSTTVSVSGSNGGDSSFSSYVAKGGGGGNSRNILTTAATGGSGGGGGYANGTNSSPGLNGGSGTTNQGYAGGNGSTSADAGGGGGGASAAGANRGGGSTTGAEGKGGDGLQYSITGTATYYAGGGGGGSYNSVGGKGGLGGGGHGGNGTLSLCTGSFSYTGWSDCGATEVTGRQGKSGVANSGGGGGGSGNEGVSQYPGDGGSGVVILRFLNSALNSSVSSIAFSGQIKKATANTITATVSVAGKVSFFANGRPIPRCANIATTAVSPFTAQCVWKPLVHGQISVTTTFVPNDSSYTNSSGGTSGVATKRTTSR